MPYIIKKTKNRDDTGSQIFFSRTEGSADENPVHGKDDYDMDFWKLHGAGNDFIIFDNRDDKYGDLSGLAKAYGLLETAWSRK
jgi:hypothetical protein